MATSTYSRAFSYSFNDILTHSQTHNKIAMADMGLKYEMAEAVKGEEQGNVEILKDLHDPGRQGTDVRGKAKFCVSGVLITLCTCTSRALPRRLLRSEKAVTSQSYICGTCSFQALLLRLLATDSELRQTWTAAKGLHWRLRHVLDITSIGFKHLSCLSQCDRVSIAARTM
jgi:hypothetical protein